MREFNKIIHYKFLYLNHHFLFF